MGYVTLARHHGKQVWRSLRRQRRWLVALAFAPIILYMVLALVGVGVYFDMLPLGALSEESPLEVLNGHLLSGLVTLFALRFVLQRPPRLSMQPYRHLPIKDATLVRYFQFASLWSLLNLLPVAFLVSFWINYVVGEVALFPAVLWLIGVLSAVLTTHFMNNLARLLLDRSTRTFLLLLLALVGVLIVDHILGSGLSQLLSHALFSALASGSVLILTLLVLLSVTLGMSSSRSLHRALRNPSRIPHREHSSGLFALNFGESPVWNLIYLELKLMRRTKRPRQYAFVSVVLAILYTGLLLSDLNVVRGPFIHAFLGLFASGAFALNYGQLMFAWESRYFDGLLARAIPPQRMVLAKLMLLQVSCIVMFLLCLPLFIWLAPRLLTMHVAFLFYNSGITCILMLALAVHNQKRVATSDGHFFNYEGFSIWHWVWLVPTVLPPALLMVVLSNRPAFALASIAGVGLINMVLAWPWCKLLSRQLKHRRYAMAKGFRSSLA